MDLIRRMVAFYRLQFRILWNWRPGRRALIRRGILSFVVAFIALTVTIWLLPGLSSANYSTIAVAVLILGVLNMAIRPLLLGLLAGISVVAVGVATLVFQVAAFLIVAALVPDFHVNNVLSAFIGSLVYGVINTILTAILAIDEDESYWAAVVQQLAASREGVVRTDKPGLVIVQIDGLAQPILAHQIRAGRVPFISHWLRSGAMKLDTWTALLPSQTSASQAGILHGNNSFIPAFRWWEKSRGRMLVSNHPEDAAEIVKRASDGEGLLSNDGASVGNLVSGDAVRSYVTMATIKDKTQGLGKSQTYLNFFASPYNYLHTIVRTVGEVVKEYVQARRSVRAGVEPSMHRGMPYPVARAATNVTLRDMSTSLVMEEMYRGTPVIYVDYTDYDEIAHHSGPERGETLDALDGVDRTVKSLVKAAEGAPRPYRFLLLSDHGQSLGATFRQRYGKTLQEVISELMGGATVIAATAPADTWGPRSAAATEASQTGGTTGAVTRAALRSRSVDGVVDLSPEMTISTETGKELPDLVVCASGNLALIYFPRVSGRVTFEEMEQRWPGMVAALSAHPGIGLLMVRSGSQGTLLIGPEGARRLEGDADPATDPVAKYGPLAILGLRRVDAMEHCGDLVVISLLDPATDEVAAFEELIGSHGGLGGPQTQPFILHPADWPIDEPIVGAENVYRQIRRWMGTIGIDLAKQRPAGAPTSPPDEPVAEALTPAV